MARIRGNGSQRVFKEPAGFQTQQQVIAIYHLRSVATARPGSSARSDFWPALSGDPQFMYKKTLCTATYGKCHVAWVCVLMRVNQTMLLLLAQHGCTEENNIGVGINLQHVL